MSESIKSTGQYLHNYESNLCFPKDVFYGVISFFDFFFII